MVKCTKFCLLCNKVRLDTWTRDVCDICKKKPFVTRLKLLIERRNRFYE
jgi:hypothetical protein